MNQDSCSRCKGACCETFYVRYEHTLITLSEDVNRWFRLHGTRHTDADGIEEWVKFECKCSALTEGGWCKIYKNRPNVCRKLEVGSKSCLEAIRDKRTEEEYEYITEEGGWD